MGDAYWAAREGDILLHTSIWADIAGAAVELACYGAIGLIPGGLIVTAVVSVAVAVTGLDDVISDLSKSVSDLFPPSEDGVILSGSPNTHINNLPAARVAGIITKPEETADEQPQQPANFIDMAANILGGLWHIAKEMARPTCRP